MTPSLARAQGLSRSEKRWGWGPSALRKDGKRFALDAGEYGMLPASPRLERRRTDGPKGGTAGDRAREWTIEGVFPHADPGGWP
jgi:hypothetical protein